MRLSFVRLTRFLARLTARPRVTLLTSDNVDGYMLWMSKKCKQIRRTRNFDPQTKAGAWKLSTALLVRDGLSRTNSLDGPTMD